MRKWLTIPILSIIISVINMLISSPLIIERFISPKVSLSVIRYNKNKDVISRGYTLINFGNKSASNVELVFEMHKNYQITGDHWTIKKEIIPIIENMDSNKFDLKLVKLSVGNIAPNQQINFFINGDVNDLILHGKSGTGRDSNFVMEPGLISCKHDQGLCNF